jgi:hypothetical protein
VNRIRFWLLAFGYRPFSAPAPPALSASWPSVVRWRLAPMNQWPVAKGQQRIRYWRILTRPEKG